MADKYLSVSALRELLGIPSDGQCTDCQYSTFHGCKDDSLLRACEAIDDAPEAVVVEKAEWDKLMFLVKAANDVLESAPKWVPVKERLPEEGKVVLVFGGRSVYTAVYGWRCGWFGWHKLNSPKSIEPTHWMPLPEPPKEVEDGN